MKIRVIILVTAAAAFAAIIHFAPTPTESFATPLHAFVTPDSTVSWDKMDFDAKKGLMKQFVMPQMKALFYSFDSVKYAKMNCKTCHGEGVASGTFKMPNPRLPKLPKTAEGFKALGEKHPDMMKFMMSSVKPTMIKLLGVQPFDPKTKTGFGCGDCHTVED